MTTHTSALAANSRDMKKKSHDNAQQFWIRVGQRASELLKMKGRPLPHHPDVAPIHLMAGEIVRQFQDTGIKSGSTAEQRLDLAIRLTRKGFAESKWTVIDSSFDIAKRAAIEAVDDAFFQITQRVQKKGRRLDRDLVARLLAE